jgi:SAM-dependent methyltransferase
MAHNWRYRAEVSGSAHVDESRQYRTSEALQSRIDLHSRFGTADRSWFDWLFDRLDLEPGDRVLDVGAGTGQLWKRCTGRVPTNVTVVLLDRSAGMIDTAMATGQPGAIGDAEALPFHDQSFDVVLASHMLYHVPRIAVALEQMRRVLQPDGRLVATTNGAGHMAELDQLAGEEPIRPSFSLENGAHQLSRSFESVRCDSYDDELHVTDPEAAVDYLRSYRDLTDDQVTTARKRIAQAIEELGSFRVSKASGAFIATQPND